MKKRVAIALAIVGVTGFAIFYWQWLIPARSGVAVGAGMLAKQMCSCMFVAERPQEDCRADQFPIMDPVTVEVGNDGRSVRAFIPLLGERSATYTEDFGCTLQ